MRDHLLRVMYNNVRETIEYCDTNALKDSPNMKEVRELMTDALTEINIEMRKLVR